MTMPLIIAASAGFLSGAAAAVLVLWLLRRRSASLAPFDYATIDPDVDQRFQQAASRWADAHGQPDSAALIVGKLRLVHNLNRKRWSR